MDFRLGADAIARGAEATRGVLPPCPTMRWRHPTMWEQLAVQRRATTPSRIDEIRIEGTQYTTADVIRAVVGGARRASFSRGQIEQDLAWLQAR